MNNNAFFCKMIFNMFANWSGEIWQDSFINNCVSRNVMYDQDALRNWSEVIEERRAAYIETLSEDRKDYGVYASLSKFLRKEDLAEIMEIMKTNYPVIAEPFTLSKNSIILQDLLDLSDNEALVLDFAIRYQDAQYPYPTIFEAFGHHGDLKEFEDRYNILFGIPAEDIEDLKKSFVMRGGLLREHSSIKMMTLTSDLITPFTHNDMTPKFLEEQLFPSNITSTLSVESYPHLEKEIDRTERIINATLDNPTKGSNLMFWGLPGTGKTELALALAKKNGWNLHIVGDISENDNEEKSRGQRLTSLKLALKLFKNDPKAVILFDEMEDLFKMDMNANFSKAFINRIIETTTIPIIWTTNSINAMGSACLRRMVYNIHFEIPPASARKVIWESAAKKYGVEVKPEMLEAFSQTYDIVPALINNSMKISSMANLHDEDLKEVVMSLDKLMNLGEVRKFEEISMKDTPYDVSCANTDQNLDNFTKLLCSATPAISLCLYGAPGTGKSEYGRYLAKQMGKKVLYKRASDLQSMWVGECEKNIAKAFKEASEGEKVLIIDEGDSFLQDRTKATANWQVSQVNEMLSQMENHDQPFIITTNLMNNLDAASLRRFTFKMKFDYLNVEQRKRLFTSYFGLEAPAALENLDILAPGDYATVVKKVKILNIQDANEIIKMLREEIEVKPDYNRSGGIGFGRG